MMRILRVINGALKQRRKERVNHKIGKNYNINRTVMTTPLHAGKVWWKTLERTSHYLYKLVLLLKHESTTCIQCIGMLRGQASLIGKGHSYSG